MPREPKVRYTTADQAVQAAWASRRGSDVFYIALDVFGPQAMTTALLSRALDDATPPEHLLITLHWLIELGPSDEQRDQLAAFMRALMDRDPPRCMVFVTALCREGMALDRDFAQALPVEARATLIVVLTMLAAEMQSFDPKGASGLLAACRVLEEVGPISELMWSAMLAEQANPVPPRRKPAATGKIWPKLEKGLKRHYQIEFKLKGAKPAPWRRILLAATATWDDLHAAIQDASGTWRGGHLWCLHLGHSTRNEMLTGAASDGWEPLPLRVPSTSKMSSVVDRQRERKFLYQYDFGDGWEVAVTVRSVVDKPERYYRELEGGELAFPPEDCGGIPGYLRSAELVRLKPERPKAADRKLLAWLGDWHPDAFDLEAAKRGFDAVRRISGRG